MESERVKDEITQDVEATGAPCGRLPYIPRPSTTVGDLYQDQQQHQKHQQVQEPQHQEPLKAAIQQAHPQLQHPPHPQQRRPQGQEREQHGAGQVPPVKHPQCAAETPFKQVHAQAAAAILSKSDEYGPGSGAVLSTATTTRRLSTGSPSALLHRASSHPAHTSHNDGGCALSGVFQILCIYGRMLQPHAALPPCLTPSHRHNSETPAVQPPQAPCTAD